MFLETSHFWKMVKIFLLTPKTGQGAPVKTFCSHIHLKTPHITIKTWVCRWCPKKIKALRADPLPRVKEQHRTPCRDSFFANSNTIITMPYHRHTDRKNHLPTT